eukprot:316666_1
MNKYSNSNTIEFENKPKKGSYLMASLATFADLIEHDEHDGMENSSLYNADNDKPDAPWDFFNYDEDGDTDWEEDGDADWDLVSMEDALKIGRHILKADGSGPVQQTLEPMLPEHGTAAAG